MEIDHKATGSGPKRPSPTLLTFHDGLALLSYFAR